MNYYSKVPIKVVSIISRMNVGGPAILLSDLIPRLDENLIDHTLITGVCLPNEVDYLATHPLEGRVIYLKNVVRSILPISDIKAFFQLCALLRSIKPDVIHTHTSKAGVLGRLAAFIAIPRAKVVHTYHGHLLYGYFSPTKVKILMGIEKLLARNTDKFIAVTSQVKSDLVKFGLGPNSKWQVITPGVVERNSPGLVNLRSELSVPNDSMLIAWIGRFTDIKNPLLALQGLSAALNIEKMRIHLVMAGAGELWEECVEYAKLKSLSVSFMGWTNDVVPLLNAADVLLMTSKNEGMPVTIVEAAFSKTSLISTKVGGVGDFISNEITGLLTDESPESIAAAISRLYFDKSFRDALSDQALTLARQEFSMDKYVKTHEELYAELTHS